MHLTQIVEEQVTTLHLCEQVRGGAGRRELERCCRKTPLGSFLAAMGKAPDVPRAAAAPGEPVPAAAPRCRTSARPAGWAARDCYATFERAAARPAAPAARLDHAHRASATLRAGATRRRRRTAVRRPGGELREQLRAGGRGRALRARGGTARPARGRWRASNDRPRAGARWRGGLARRQRARKSHGALDPGPAGAQPGRTAVHRAATAIASGKRCCATVEAAAASTPTADDRRCCSGWTGWSTADRQLLHERHLVSRNWPGSRPSAGPNRGRRCCSRTASGVMVNEEDHLRLQGLRSGFALEAAYDEVRPAGRRTGTTTFLRISP